METFVSLLQNTMHPDHATRTQVEQQLKTFETNPGFLQALLTILQTLESDRNVRQAAAIYFKNRIQQGWDPSRKSPINDLEKQSVRDQILSVLVSSIDVLPIRSQLVTALGAILAIDASDNAWPAFLPQIQSFLSTQDPKMIHTGLLGLHELTKVFQWSSSAKRAPLDHIISTTYPHLLIIASNLVTNDSPQAGEMLKLIVKTFCGSIRLELSKSLQDSNILSGWASLFVQVVEKQVTGDVSLSPEDREKYPWWKAKKWALQCLYHLYSRYSRAFKKDKRYIAFSKMFMEFFVPNIVHAYLRQVQALISGMWMSNRVKQQLAMFLEECIKPKSTWLIVKPHLEPLIVQFIFPLLCFSDSDQELWDEDPVEFIHKKIDPPMDDYRSPVTAAEELLRAIIRDRFKQTFIPTMTFINSILTSYQNAPIEQRNPRQKDGVLRMISYLAEDVLGDESPVKDQMEMFIYTHVIPELTSAHGFLRARACDVLLKFGEVEYKNDKQLAQVFQGILNGLKDPELAVRVSAALAISPFLEHSIIHDAMTPHVHTIMQELLNLTNEIDMDTLTHVMEQLVSDFSDHLAPFAVQLATQLRDTFMRVMGDVNLEKEDVDFDEAENKTMTAMGILKTISSLIMAVEASKTILAELETVLAPAIALVIQHSVLDLYEEIFEIIEMLTYCSKSISPFMWQLFELIYNTFKTDIFDYIEEVAPTLDNYVTFGAQVIMQNPQLQERFFELIQLILVTDMDYIGTSDRIRAFQLMESMMLNLKPCIDAYIPKFMQFALGFLTDEAKIKNIPLRVHVLEVIINSIYYNPMLALSILEQNNATLPFFGLWFKNLDHFGRVHDKKLCILTICAILELPLESLPQSVQSGWLQLFEGLLKVFETYGSALENRKHEERLANGEIEDDETDQVEEEDDETSYHTTRLSSEHDPDDDCHDENDEEYYELLGRKADEQALHDDEDDDDWDVDITLDEDVYFITVLDKLDGYNRFEDLMNTLSARPDIHAHLNQSLSPEKRTAVEGIIIKSRQLRTPK